MEVAPTAGEMLANTRLQYSTDSGASFSYMTWGNQASTVSTPFGAGYSDFYYTADSSGMFNYLISLSPSDLACPSSYNIKDQEDHCSAGDKGCNYDQKHAVSQDFYITIRHGFNDVSADHIKIRGTVGQPGGTNPPFAYGTEYLSAHEIHTDTTWHFNQFEVCHGDSYESYDQSQSYSDVPIGSSYYDITVSGRSVYDLYHIVFKNNPTYFIKKTVITTGGQEVTVGNNGNEMFNPAAGTSIYSYKTQDADGRTQNINFLYIFPEHAPSITISQNINANNVPGFDYIPKFSKQIDYSYAGGCSYNGGGTVTFGRLAFDRLNANILKAEFSGADNYINNTIDIYDQYGNIGHIKLLRLDGSWEWDGNFISEVLNVGNVSLIEGA